MTVDWQYLPQDAPFVRQLSADLLDLGTKVDAKKSPSPDTSRDGQLKSPQGQLIVVVLSGASVASPLLREQLGAAFRFKPHSIVVPILSEPCVLPSWMGLHVPIDFSSSYQSGLIDLRAHLEASGPDPAARISSQGRSHVVARSVLQFLAFRLKEHGGSRSMAQADLGLEESLKSLFQSKEPACTLQLMSARRQSGVDVVLLGGRDLTGPWLIQVKCDAAGKQARVESVESVVSMYGRLDGAQACTFVSRASTVGLTVHDPFERQGPSLDCWRLEPSRLRLFYQWLDSAPELGSEIVQPVGDAHQRYSDLVDKRFLGELSDPERVEIAHLEGILDQEEATFYDAAKHDLIEREQSILVDRYSDLVDTKFTTGISAAEEGELRELADALDRHEAEFYEPIKRRLLDVLDRFTHRAGE